MVCMHARAGRLALDACMADQRATQIFSALPEGKFRLRIKFLREPDKGDWVVEDKFDPVWAERKKGQGVIEITRGAKPGDLPTSDSDAASWAHIVHLVAEATTNNGTVPEGPLYLTNKRYVDEKDALCVLKSGDTMTGNLLLSAGSDLVRLLGCTDLTPGKGFSLALGKLQNQIQFEVIAPPQPQTPLTLKTTHDFLIQSNDSDVIRIGGNITMVYSNRRILNLPELSSDNEAATKSYVDSRKQRITFGPKRRAQSMRDNMNGRLVMGVTDVNTPSVDIQCWRRVECCEWG